MVNQDLPWRKISKDKYIIAGVITLLIFSLGISLGFIFENQRYALLGDINQEQEVKYLSLQLQYLYLNYFSSYNNCPTLTTTLKETIKDLSDSLSEVIAFEEQNKVSTNQHQVVQRRYVLDNLRYWLLAKESKQKCDMNIVPILYFYTQECSSCPNQGTVLSYFKSVFGEQVLVFPINLDLRQADAGKAHGPFRPMPVLYVTQLLGLALGLPQEALGIDALAVSPKTLLAKRDAVAAGGAGGNA